MFFDRYKTDIRRICSSFEEYNPLYCNPLNYCTTYEECAEYANKIDTAQKRYKEWEKQFDNRTKLIKIVMIVLSLVLYLALIVYIYDLISDDGLYALLKSIFAIASGYFFYFCIIPFMVYFIEELRHLGKKGKESFFPVQNKCIEKLFDDYLWKEEYLWGDEYKFSYSPSEKERLINGKTMEDKFRQRERLIALSHPYLDLFKETVAQELAFPSDVFVFGDVKFGMTPEEIYQTNCFKGLHYDSEKFVNLGFRGRELGCFWGIRCSSTISFIFDNNYLSSVLVKENMYRENKNTTIEQFITCCKKLYHIYGPPVNLYKPFRSDHLQLNSCEKAEFNVGYKRILLCIDHEKSSSYSYRYGIKIEFSRITSVKERKESEVIDFDDHWFDELRKTYDSAKYRGSCALEYDYILDYLYI